MKTDPKKTEPTKKKSPQASELIKTQQISDNLAQKVAKGVMSHSQAMKMQRKKDSTKMATVKKVGEQGTGQPQSAVKMRDAKFKRNNKGNVVAY